MPLRRYVNVYFGVPNSTFMEAENYKAIIKSKCTITQEQKTHSSLNNFGRTVLVALYVEMQSRLALILVPGENSEHKLAMLIARFRVLNALTL